MACIYYKPFKIQYGAIDDCTLTVIGTVRGLSNGFSRVMWGFLQDRVGLKPHYSFIFFMQLVIAPTIITVFHKTLVYEFWILLGYACLGENYIFFLPAAITKLMMFRLDYNIKIF